MNTQLNSGLSTKLGDSKALVNVLGKSRKDTTSGIIISGVVRSGKSPTLSKSIKKTLVERKFKAKRQRREMRNRK